MVLLLTWQGCDFDPLRDRLDRSRSDFWSTDVPGCPDIRQAYADLDELLCLPNDREHQFVFCCTLDPEKHCWPKKRRLWRLDVPQDRVLAYLDDLACLLPPALFAELQAIAGPTYVFERFAEQLREIHLKKGHPGHARCVRGFQPHRLKDWLQDQLRAYLDTSEAAPFKLHNFRGTAMSKARMARTADSDAAIAFGCNPTTMRQHYHALDEVAIADDVFSRMAATQAAEPAKQNSCAGNVLGLPSGDEKRSHVSST
jgi:hypothetical protein